MKQYSILEVPVKSFFSGSLYRDVCFQRKDTLFIYLLLLLAVCMIPPMVMLDKQLTRFVENEAPEIVSQVPVLFIIDGRASTDESRP